MYEKNGIVTSPVVDANSVSIGTRKTLLSRKEGNVEAIFSFVRRCLQAFFLSEVVRSLYNWERLFRSEREPRSCRGWTESLVADDRNHWHDVGRRDVLLQPLSVQASPSVSPPAGTCGRGQREKKQPTHHPRVDLCWRRSLAGKTAVGDEGLDAASSLHDAMDSAETCGWQRKRSEPVDSVASDSRRRRRRRRRSPPEAASRIAWVGDSFSVLVM